MELREYRRIVRQHRLDDNATQADGTPGTRMWSDDEIDTTAREAQIEACERADLLMDAFTPSICQVAIVANQEFYDLHPSVYRVLDARYADTGQVLTPTEIDKLDDGSEGGYVDAYGWRPGRGGRWLTQVASRSRCFYVDFTARERAKLRPFPIGNVATYTDDNGDEQPLVLKLRVYRRPIWPLKSPTDQFEIHDRYCGDLVYWTLARLYEKRDSDAQNIALSEKYDRMFNEAFGEKPSYRTQTDRRERHRETIAPWGIG